MWKRIIATALAALSAAPALAQTDQKIYFVPDVAAQFNALALRPEPFGFGSPDDFDPFFLDYHYQGIVRKNGPGVPYLFVSRNRDGAGYVLVVKMASRDRSGERLRSNRLFRDSELSPRPGGRGGPGPGTLPDVRDTTVTTIKFDGHNGWPAYHHPGGMQLVGNILAVPLSQPETGFPSNRVAFIDVTNPEAPTPTSFFDPDARGSSEFGVGQVALTAVQNPEGPGVRYIMLLAGESNKDVRLYRSVPTNSVTHETDLASPELQWLEIGAFGGETLDDPGQDTWPCCGSQSHQMFSFVRQQSLDGPLFLIGAFNDDAAISPGGGHDYIDLYEVHVDRFGTPEERLLSHVERKHVTTNSIGGDTGHFAGSTGVYVSPSGELIVYSTEHTNQGPVDGNGRNTIRAGEWRHREMVRPDSPTLRPSVSAGTFTVDEGGSRTLVGAGRPPLTRAWLQLFIDDGLGLSPSNFNKELVVDFDDRAKDDFDDFGKMLWFFNDEASSWRWFAPQGCTVNIQQHSDNDPSFPGRYKVLVGQGVVSQETNLDTVQGDNEPGSMNDMISGAGFSCGRYYSTPIRVSWDLDRNGSYETVGETALISADTLDGPGIYEIPVQATHQTDTTALGIGAPQTVQLTVVNVAPVVTGFLISDPLGGVVGTTVPFGIVGIEYAARGSFIDQGKLDHQAATLKWGDGTIDQSSGFRVFTDAFGGATGQAEQRHKFRAAGTYTIELDVVDDDQGAGAITTTVEIVSASGAIGRAVTDIDVLLPTVTNAKARKAIELARRALAGGQGGDANNGALDKLAGGETNAALTKVLNAIEELRRAQSDGADVSALIALLEQVAVALSA